MITDFVRNGQAWLRCEECGEETTILKYEYDERYKSPMINHEKTIESIDAFTTKHALCKKVENQLELKL
jgi:hypothetical protein